jgi:hypothetical protein
MAPFSFLYNYNNCTVFSLTKSGSELVFLNVYGAPESIPRNEFRQSLCSLAGRYNNPIPPRCLAPIGFLKIPAQYENPMPPQFLASKKTFFKITALTINRARIFKPFMETRIDTKE